MIRNGTIVMKKSNVVNKENEKKVVISFSDSSD